MEHEFEEEIEFFSFLPSELYEDVEYAVGDAFDGVVAKSGRKSVDALEDALRKNMAIFEKYTHKNIFVFPPGFVYERKKCDIYQADLKGLLLDISIAIEQRNARTEELNGRKTELERLRKKRLELEEKGGEMEEDLDFVIEQMKKLNVLLGGTLEIKKRFLASGRRAAKREYLGGKDVVREVRKREVEKAERIAGLATLDKIGSVIP